MNLNNLKVEKYFIQYDFDDKNLSIILSINDCGDNFIDFLLRGEYIKYSTELYAISSYFYFTYHNKHVYKDSIGITSKNLSKKHLQEGYFKIGEDNRSYNVYVTPEKDITDVILEVIPNFHEIMEAMRIELLLSL